MHRSLIAATSIAAALLLPAVAGASTITSTGTSPYLSTTFQAGPGSSDVTLTSSDVWSDAAQTLTAGPGCTPLGAGQISCPVGTADVFFRNANDQFTNTFSFSNLRIHGAGGADRIVANGSDTQAWGDNGTDFIDVNSNSTTKAYGGAGADELRARGSGAEVEGGDGADLIVGATSVNKSLAGNAGADQVIDPIGSFANIDGGPGNDTLVSLGLIYNGTINILGGDGNDTIQGATRPVEHVDAGAGKDVVNVYDGTTKVDTVTCGANKDIVYADPSDTVAADCEKVVRDPAPTLNAVTAALAHYAATFPDSPQPPAV